MNFSKQIFQIVFVSTLSLLFVVLSTHSSYSADTSGVYFTAPADKATVSSPVKVIMGAENFIVEPAGPVKSGAGHLHIIIDADCVAAGLMVQKDATHLHYGKGQMEAELTLSPGEHTLCLQAADGIHTALAGKGMTQKITLTVK